MGNQCFKEKGYKDAKSFYGKEIQVFLIEVRKRQKETSEGEGTEKGVEQDEEEVKKEVEALEACLLNRAAWHLELKNYCSYTLDCGSWLKNGM